MMAIRKPAGILVTGTSIFIKDPNAAAGSLFANVAARPRSGVYHLAG